MVLCSPPCRMWCLQHTIRRRLRLSRRRLSNVWMPIVRQMGGVGQTTVRMRVRRRGWHRVCIGPGMPFHRDQAVKGQAWLAAQQQADGSFANDWGPSWRALATAQAVPVLRGLQSLDTIGANPARVVTVDGWVPPRRLVQMTVLGDSYSAGNGTLVDGYPADGSYRSPKNYGSVLTRKLNREFGVDTTFQTDVRAWSGAQITTGDTILLVRPTEWIPTQRWSS